MSNTVPDQISKQNENQNGVHKYFNYNQPSTASKAGPQSVPFQKQRFNPYNSQSNSSTSYFQKNYSQLSTAISQSTSALPTSYSYQVKYGGVTTTAHTNSNNVVVVNDTKDSVTLQISNLDSSVEETALRNFLISQLKPITPIVSLNFENPSLAKVKVPSPQYAKLVVAHLHRKKIGHKRMIVSYIRDPSSAESSALRCQVAGLLKDVPNYTLPVYRFRELFQSRFKTSISVMDLYRMHDICNITVDKNEEKIISLQPELVVTMKSNPLVESSQHSVPYCIYHFKREQEKGWAEQEIEQLPSVLMSIAQIQSIIYGLLKTHKDDIPIASLVHCIESELNIKVVPQDKGVNLEHLVCCVRGVQINNNSFGIKVVTWMEHDSPRQNSKETLDDVIYSKYNKMSAMGDSLTVISREVIELIKMFPKSTMKFNRFIPAYHNHFGKQCRVADYGYTRLIELFEALSNVVQVMGDGENRQITLTHQTQMRRFTTDLLKILRSQVSKSILLSHLPSIFSQYQNRPFEITEYGVCDINDILDGLMHNNSIVVTTVQNGAEILLSMIKRKQTPTELEKTCIFAGEVVELFRNAPQFSIFFNKFVRSYHYHFGYQCRLSDYGFLKLADLVEAISGVVEMEATNTSDGDRKIYLSHKMALRVFAEQLQELIVYCTGKSQSMIKLNEILRYHKSKFGYQIQPQNFGFYNMVDVIRAAPYIELFETDGDYWIISHLDDPKFRFKAYAVCHCFHESNTKSMPLSKFLKMFMQKFNDNITEKILYDMKHAVQIFMINGTSMVALTPLMKFILDIVQILETTSPLNLFDLKTMMNLTASSCFDFGYPNISSLVQAYADIFLSSNATNIHERSDIELNPDCIFSKKYNKNYKDQLENTNIAKQAAVQQQSQPENKVYSQACNQQCMNNHCNKPIARPPMSVCNNRSPYDVQLSSNGLTCFNNYQYNNQNSIYNSSTTNSSYNSTGSSVCNMSFGEVSQSTLLNKENIYYGVQQTRSSHNSNNTNGSSNYNSMINNNNYSNLNNSINNNCCNTNETNTGAKLYERRNVPGLQHLNNGGLLLNNIGNNINSNNSNLNNNSNSYNNDKFDALSFNINGNYLLDEDIRASLFGFYEPPKPDTPPSRVIPFWVDPIWNSGSNRSGDPSQAIETLNIHLPELKALSIVPVILSPCQISLSVNKKATFSFDTADIKGHISTSN